MQVFVTGGTGYVGKAVASAFVKNGDEVWAMTRSLAGAAALSEIGARPFIGNLGDPSSYRNLLSTNDVLIHLGYDYGVAAEDAEKLDRTTIVEFLDSASRSWRRQHVLYTSSAFLEGGTDQQPITEFTAMAPPAPVASRAYIERELLERGLCAPVAVIRLGMVYGGTGGTVSKLFSLGVSEGLVPYVGNGRNHWAMIHVDDVAQLFLVVAAKRGEGIFHGVDGLQVTSKRVAELIASSTGANAVAESCELARQRWGDFALTLGRDVFVDAPRSRGIGWQCRFASFEAALPTMYSEWLSRAFLSADSGDLDKLVPRT